MLNALARRGPDSAGAALYGHGEPSGEICWIKLGESEDTKRSEQTALERGLFGTLGVGRLVELDPADLAAGLAVTVERGSRRVRSAPGQRVEHREDHRADRLVAAGLVEVADDPAHAQSPPCPACATSARTASVTTLASGNPPSLAIE